MNMMKTRLEKESTSHAETRKQLEELLARVEDIRLQVLCCMQIFDAVT